MLRFIQIVYTVTIILLLCWTLSWIAIKPLPPGSHLNRNPDITFSNDTNQGIYIGNGLDTNPQYTMYASGIQIIGIDVVYDETGCVIEVRYFYAGRVLCWDGKSNSFEEIFKGNKNVQ